MTRTDLLTCVHEPFGDAFYFGPERLSDRYENDPEARKASGFENSTYKTIFERIENENKEVRCPESPRVLRFFVHFSWLYTSLSASPFPVLSKSLSLAVAMTRACIGSYTIDIDYSFVIPLMYK